MLYRSGPGSQLAPLCHGVTPLQRHDDRDVPDLRLQTPLARSRDERFDALVLDLQGLNQKEKKKKSMK